MDTSTTNYLVFKSRDKKHKSKPSQFVSVAGGVQKRFEANLKHRKGSRLTVFDSVRNLSQTASPVKQDEAEGKCEHRRQQLEKWKQEKDKKKKEQAANKKKPFVAGVVPVPLKFELPPPQKPMPSSSGRVTRSQAAKVTTKPELNRAQSFAPKNASFRPPLLKNPTVPPLPSVKTKKEMKQVFTFDPVVHVAEKTAKSKSTRPKVVVSSTQVTQEPIKRMNTRSKVATTNANVKVVKSKVTKSPKKTKKITDKLAGIQMVDCQVALTNGLPIIHTRRSINRQYSPEETRKLDHDSPILQNTVTPNKLTPKTSIPKSESRSEEKLRSPKDAVVTPNNPIQSLVKTKISPCVTLSRGKENARRETKKKLQEGLLAEDAGTTDDVQHFRRQMQLEIARITRRCEEWDAVYENTEIPDFVQEQVLSTLGQARLLMTQKMQQFASLVDRCEARDTVGQPVTPGDLQGFWDMVFLQIENVDMNFLKLEQLRAREWAEAAPAPPARRPAGGRRAGGKRAGVKPAPVKPAPPASAPSRLREMIAAARKAKQEVSTAAAGGLTPGGLTPGGDSKTFEAGFFSVSSPVRSPAPATPRAPRASLLRNVLSSEARKASASKQSASYAMLHASIIGKNIEIEGIAPLEQTPRLTSINLNATPARSILKSTAKPSAKKSGKKSIKTVLFDESDDETEVKTKETEATTDSGMSSMDAEKEPANKENRQGKLVRQDALDHSPVMTRNRRKSMNTPKEEVKCPKRTTRRKKALQEAESNIIEDARSKSSINDEAAKCKDTPRRSRRSKATEDLIDFATPEVTPSKARRSGTKRVDV